ncbi:hypothetical protein NL676_023223 [Syzygium grande]|nr:hypothetical protein NL676_023223 [Syzygium grande]
MAGSTVAAGGIDSPSAIVKLSCEAHEEQYIWIEFWFETRMSNRMNSTVQLLLFVSAKGKPNDETNKLRGIDLVHQA